MPKMELTWHQKAFLYGTYASYIMFVLAFVGIVTDAPQYLGALNTALEYYVCAFLLIQFNPLVKIRTRDVEFDRNIAFSAGVLMLLSIVVAMMDHADHDADGVINFAELRWLAEGPKGFQRPERIQGPN